MSELDSALRVFEAAQANLEKLERLVDHIRELTPEGITFDSEPKYEDAVRSFKHILDSLPTIDGWKPRCVPPDLDEIAQYRLDADMIGEPEVLIDLQRNIEEPSKELREYRFRFDLKRRALIRIEVAKLTKEVTETLIALEKECKRRRSSTKLEGNPRWEKLNALIAQIDTLIGSSVSRPKRWGDLSRHLSFAEVQDLNDIATLDWPEVSLAITQKLYRVDDPLPVDAKDLSDVVNAKPTGTVATALAWDRLSSEDFERLVFALISNQTGYENPEWLMATPAPDRGRDLSVVRATNDPLTGTQRERIIIQCRHWLSRSVSTSDVSTLRDQMQLWEPPRIDELIIATSGRFSADAVSLIEKNNQSNTSLKIQMWPESHLERLLAARPGLIADFGLR